MIDPSNPHHRLAIYGSLAPGEANAWVLAGIDGRWLEGWVRGTKSPADPAAGHPHPRFHPDGPDRVRVLVFESPDLPHHLPRLDAFEAPDYQRVVVTVHLDGAGEHPCSIYAWRPEPSRRPS